MKIIRPNDISKLIIKKTLEGNFVLINQSIDLKSFFIIPCISLNKAQYNFMLIREAHPGEILQF